MSFAPDSPLVARIHPSANSEPRRLGAPDILLLHYTGLHDVERAIHWLSAPESKVSCHYVVGTDGAITQMVPEALRAWHAGVASWAGETDINSASIGIEIHNPGHEQGYPDFPEAQMRAVIALCRDILARHAIPPPRVLAHSDVAPKRKIDPGEKFDWRRLATCGIGQWVEPVPADGDRAGAAQPDASGPAVAEAQRLLAAYGYGVTATGVHDEDSVFVVRAFQRHFRPALVDGAIDRSTLDTARRLLSSLKTAGSGRPWA